MITCATCGIDGGGHRPGCPEGDGPVSLAAAWKRAAKKYRKKSWELAGALVSASFKGSSLRMDVAAMSSTVTRQRSEIDTLREMSDPDILKHYAAIANNNLELRAELERTRAALQVTMWYTYDGVTRCMQCDGFKGDDGQADEHKTDCAIIAALKEQP